MKRSNRPELTALAYAAYAAIRRTQEAEEAKRKESMTYEEHAGRPEQPSFRGAGAAQ